MTLTVLGRTVEVRECRPEDERALRDLYEVVFGVSSTEALRDREWRYARNPAGPHRTMVAVLDDGELIASYTGIPLRGRLAGTDAAMAVMEDAMTHPAWRGAMLGRTGVFVRTVHGWIETFARGTEQAQFCYGTPQPRHARLGRLLMGYDLWTEIGYYSREVRDTLIKRVRRMLPDRRIVPVVEFGAEADELWERLKPAYPSAVVRDSTYLRWRYNEAPVREYLPLALRAPDGRWVGWIVLAVRDDTATFVDALLPREPPAAALALVYRAIGIGLDRGARHFQGWASRGSGFETLLQRSGFWNTAFEGSRFAARVMDPAFDPQQIRREWYFQPGDTDEF